MYMPAYETFIYISFGLDIFRCLRKGLQCQIMVRSLEFRIYWPEVDTYSLFKICHVIFSYNTKHDNKSKFINQQMKKKFQIEYFKY